MDTMTHGAEWAVSRAPFGLPRGYEAMEMAYLREHSGRDLNLEAPFADDECRVRLRRTRGAMAELGIEVLILTAPEGMCYLHNYQA